MAQADVRTIKAQLKKGELNNIYYLYGLDVSGVEALTRAIIKKAVGDNEEFALTKLDGGSLNITEFRDIAEMMPMMSDYNCILINDYNCSQQREEVNKELINVLKNIPDRTVVIFNITGFDVKDGKAKIDAKNKNKKLIDFAAKNGIVCEQGIKTPAQLAKDIAAKVSARGGAVTIQNAQDLAARCLSDQLMIDNEIDKLCAYAKGREISAEMMDMLTPHQSSITVYNLSSAISSLNKKSAFDALDDLLERFPKSDDRRYLLTVISGVFIDMYRASCARQTGRDQGQVMHDFGYKWDFIVKNAFRDSYKMSPGRIRRCLCILRDTAQKMNSTAVDEKILLEEAVAEMLTAKND